jgi:23S rRNA (guanosine2251-2'-O)-methyltransferase
MSNFIYGKNAVLEALRAHVPAKRLIVERNIKVDEKIREILSIAHNWSIVLKEVRPANFEDETRSWNQNHQGIALELVPFKYEDAYEFLDPAFFNASNKDRDPNKKIRLAVLDGVTDPHNLGAIIRSAVAFGVDAIVLPKKRSAEINGTVWKTSSGKVANIPIGQVSNLNDFLKRAQAGEGAESFWALGLSGSPKDNPRQLDDPTLDYKDQNIIIVVGSEGAGISELTRKICDELIAIPISENVESLNASVAAAIAFYTL